MEIIKPIDDIITRGPFMGCQIDRYTTDGLPAVAPGLGLGAVVGLEFYKEMLDLYARIHFLDSDGNLNLKTVVHYTTEKLCEHSLGKQDGIQQVANIWIYAKEYFCPLDTLLRMNMTENSRTIHHFSSSWLPWHKQLIKRIKRLLGYSFSSKVREILVKVRILRK